MKNLLLASAFVFGALLITGCKPSPEASVVPSPETAAEQLDKAQAATDDAVQEMKDFAFAQRAEFVTTMQAKLAELNRSFDDLAARIETSSDAVKAEAGPKLAALREQTALLIKQVEAVQDATPTTWSGVKADAQKTYTALQDGMSQARQWVSDKIAP